MNTHTIQTYSFHELATDIQQQVIEKNRDINMDHEWYNYIEEGFIEDMEALGYEVDKMHFSGFSSQGDGACFEGRVDIEDWLKAHKLGNKYKKLLHHVKGIGGSVKITQSGHYYHEYSMSYEDNITDYYMEIDKKVNQQADEVYSVIKDEATAKAKELYRLLENEYNYLTSDDAIKETLVNNDYEFTEDGGIFS